MNDLSAAITSAISKLNDITVKNGDLNVDAINESLKNIQFNPVIQNTIDIDIPKIAQAVSNLIGNIQFQPVIQNKIDLSSLISDDNSNFNSSKQNIIINTDTEAITDAIKTSLSNSNKSPFNISIDTSAITSILKESLLRKDESPFKINIDASAITASIKESLEANSPKIVMSGPAASIDFSILNKIYNELIKFNGRYYINR